MERPIHTDFTANTLLQSKYCRISHKISSGMDSRVFFGVKYLGHEKNLNNGVRK